MIPHTLVIASADIRLRRDEYRVLIHLYTELSPFEFRKVKQMSLARSVHLRKQPASRSMAKLIACGYLMRGEKVDGVYTYRLNTPVAAGETSRLPKAS